MQETWVRSLGCEDTLEKGMAIHSSTLAWRIPWMEKQTVHGIIKSQKQLSDFHYYYYDYERPRIAKAILRTKKES